MCGKFIGHVNFDLDPQLQDKMEFSRYQRPIDPKLSQIDTENVLTVNRKSCVGSSLVM